MLLCFCSSLSDSLNSLCFFVCVSFFLFRKFNLNLILLTQKDKLHAVLPIAWLHDTILKIRCVSHLVSSYSFFTCVVVFFNVIKS